MLPSSRVEDGTFGRPRPVMHSRDGMSVASEELIRRAKAGDRRAFDELVGPLVDQAFRLAYGMLHDRAAAEDAVQEAGIRAWRKLHNLRPGTPMKPWFFGIVANECRNLVRSRWWSVLRLDNRPEGASSGFEESVLHGADIRAALRALPLDQREALVLRYYCDLPVDEVASIVGVPAGTIKSRINRGLTAMQMHFVPLEALT